MNIPDFVKKREDSNQGFDLYFAGAVNKHLECWFDRTQALKLFTQVTDKKAIKIHIDKCPNNKIFLDSGAWAAHSRGVSLDVDGYINYANSISDYVNAIAQVDHIPGVYRQVKTREQLLEAPKLSWKNYLYMKDKMKDRDKLLPIFHQGEDFK